MKRMIGMLSIGWAVAACGPQEDASVAGFRPGQWSMTLHTEAELPTAPPEYAGIGKAMAKDDSFEFCMSPEMASDPRQVLLGAFGRAECTDDHFRMAAGAVDIKANCQPGGTMHSFTVKGRYKNASFEVDRTADMVTDPMVGKLIAHMNVKGRRTGDCDPTTAAAEASNRQLP